MDAELPKCRLCGAVPVRPFPRPHAMAACHNPECRLVQIDMTDTDWRRLHGPRLAPEHVEALRELLACMERIHGAGDYADRPQWREAIRAVLGIDTKEG